MAGRRGRAGRAANGAIDPHLAPFDVLVTNPDAQGDTEYQKKQDAADGLDIKLVGAADQVRLINRPHSCLR